MVNRTFIAVYGSLMSGFHNHELIKDAVFMGPATAEFHATMVTAGGFPYLCKEEPDAKPKVELYAVNDEELADVDALEGHPHWYEREEKHFLTPQGERVKAWIYIMPDPTCQLITTHATVTDGDWKKYKEVK